MARIDRARLDAARLPFATELQTRFADADIQGHVNNVRTVELLQEGRVSFNRAVGMVDRLGGLGAMVAGVTIEYARQLTWTAPVTAHAGVLEIGRSSWRMGQLLRQQGEDGTFAETAMVLVAADGPVALPDDFRRALQTMMIG